jgi:hypothetical protein
MKRISILPIALGIILLAACKKDNKPTVLDVTVSTGAVSPSGMKIYLLSDAHRTTADNVASGTADANGKIDFNVTPGQVYYLYNGTYGLISANPTYIITGKFTSQDQINSSPAQTPAAQIGDNIEADVNGDGVVNGIDEVIKVTAPAKGITSQVSITLNIPIP